MLETPQSVIPHSGKEMTIGQSAGKSYAYLLGVYLGDGCVTTHQGRLVFRLNTIDEDFALATKAALEIVSTRKVGLCKHSVEKSNNANYAIRCGDEDLCKRLRKETGNKSFLPSWYLNDWSDEMRKAFIVGLMDSEGFVAEGKYKTGRSHYMGFKSCDVWVPHFIEMLQSEGLKIGKVQTERPYKPGYKPATRFSISMQSWVDSGMRFNIKRKQDRVDRWAATEPYSERSRYPRKLTSETARRAASCG